MEINAKLQAKLDAAAYELGIDANELATILLADQLTRQESRQAFAIRLKRATPGLWRAGLIELFYDIDAYRFMRV